MISDFSIYFYPICSEDRTMVSLANCITLPQSRTHLPEWINVIIQYKTLFLYYHIYNISSCTTIFIGV